MLTFPFIPARAGIHAGAVRCGTRPEQLGDCEGLE